MSRGSLAAYGLLMSANRCRDVAGGGAVEPLETASVPVVAPLQWFQTPTSGGASNSITVALPKPPQDDTEQDGGLEGLALSEGEAGLLVMYSWSRNQRTFTNLASASAPEAAGGPAALQAVSEKKSTWGPMAAPMASRKSGDPVIDDHGCCVM